MRGLLLGLAVVVVAGFAVAPEVINDFLNQFRGL